MIFKCHVILIAGAMLWGTVTGLENAPQLASPTSTATNTPQDTLLYPSLDAMEKLYQPYLINLQPYEPIYFLVGANPEDSKFQLSFKYRFFNRESRLAQRHPYLSGLHLGYTQTSYWDLKSDSQPFEDTSYKPEMFWLSPNLDPGWSGVRGLFMQTGFQHESNGRGTTASRSTNHLYIKPSLIFYDEDSRWGLLVAPRLWVYLANDNDTNADLYRYRGYWSLELKAGQGDGWVVGSHLRWADKGGSMQLDATYPLDRILNKHLDLFLHIQYVDTLAETLLDYKERTRALRLGIALVR